MSFEPLTLTDVARVALAMREADRAEVFATRWGYDPIPLAHQLVEFARFGVVAKAAGEPVAVLAAREMHPRVYQVGMFATDAWPQVGRALTRWCLRVLRPALLSAGGHRAECRSLGTHTTAHRWLETLGFRVEGVLRDCGAEREDFVLFAWRLSDHVHV